MNAARSAVLGYSRIFAPSPRKPCHSSPSSSSHGGAYSVNPVRSLTVSVIGMIGACGLVMVAELTGGPVNGSGDLRDHAVGADAAHLAVAVGGVDQVHVAL